jgi:hypothetical protein
MANLWGRRGRETRAERVVGEITTSKGGTNPRYVAPPDPMTKAAMGEPREAFSKGGYRWRG